MNFKSIMLAGAAGLATVTAAAAADLPGEAVPSAVDYVKVCDTFGAGFFYIPGTETCLDISGRVRFRVQYDGYQTRPGLFGPSRDVDLLRFRADARVDFDTRTSTEYGTLRTFTRLGDELSESFESSSSLDQKDTAVGIKLAFIQLGYFTAGLQGDVANGDVLYGDNSAGYFTGDSDLVGMTVLADDLGGGFYAGVGVYSGHGGRDNVVWGDISGVDDYADIMVQAAIGIAGQPWGGVDLSAVWNGRDSFLPAAGSVPVDDLWSIKATADLTLIESLNARLVAAYANSDYTFGDDVFTLAGALSYAFSDAVTVYTGARYDITDGSDDLYTNLGVDYTIVDGLVGTAEISYADLNDDDNWVGLLQLSRSW